MPLSQSFYDRSPEIVAEQLLGKLLVRNVHGQQTSGFIVETEAYLAKDDPASHSFRGMTKRNRSMFASPGTLYVYAIHGTHCMNVVTESKGTGSAVLIRAVEPHEGVDPMAQRRATREWKRLCRGPGMLCQAFSVNRDDDGLDLTLGTGVWIEEWIGSSNQSFRCKRSPRIGIRNGEDLALRFYLDGNWFVSGLRRDHSSRPTRGLLLNPNG